MLLHAKALNLAPAKQHVIHPEHGLIHRDSADVSDPLLRDRSVVRRPCKVAEHYALRAIDFLAPPRSQSGPSGKDRRLHLLAAERRFGVVGSGVDNVAGVMGSVEKWLDIVLSSGK